MTAGVELRVLGYNVRGLRAGPSVVSDVIRSAGADLVCLQEAPVRVRWRSRAAALARRSDLYVVTGGRPAAGNLLLCSPRVHVLRAAEHRLSRRPGMPPRGCTSALVDVGGVRLGVVGTHLGLRASERQVHAAEIAEIAGSLRADGARAVVVAADLNAPWSAQEWSPLRAELRDTAGDDPGWATFPARSPAARIDVVLVDGTITDATCAPVHHAEVTRASDHRPVLAVVRVGPG